MNEIKKPTYSLITHIIFIVFSFVFVFASQDPNFENQHPMTEVFHNLFLQGFGHKHFSFMQFMIFLISMIAFHYHWSRKKISRNLLEKRIIFLTVIYILMLLLNPNSNVSTPILGLPLFSDPDLYFYLLFMIAIFLMRSNEDFIFYFRILMKYLLIFFVIRVFYLLLLRSFGQGVNYLGFQSVTMEEDTLILAVLVQIIFLALYYIKKEKKYIFLVLLFQIFQILSFRRSGLLLSFLVLGSYLFLFYSNYNILKRFVSTFILLIAVLFFFLNLDIMPRSYLLLVHRYVGAFVTLPGTVSFADIARNDHFDQSNKSIFEHARHLDFWGFGYGSSQTRFNFNYKNNTGIHNVYFNLWEWQGLFALVYYLILIYIFFTKVYDITKNYKKLEICYKYLKMSLIIFFIFYLFNSYVLMMVNFTGIKMKVLWILIFAFMLKVNQNNYKLLFIKN